MEYPPRIQELLKKYWQAETTIEEERELGQYFVLHPEHRDGQAAYFLLLKEQREVEMPGRHSSIKGIMRPTFRRTLSIAAAVLVLVVAGILIQRQVQPPVQQEPIVETVEDPREAYEQARQALLLVSAKLNNTQDRALEKMQKARPYTEILK